MLFSVVSIVFIPIGAIVIGISSSVIEVEMDDYASACCIRNCDASATWKRVDANPCSVTVTVPAHMEPPIFVYYKLTKYYQNHRRYVRSRDDRQLRGEVREASDLQDSDSCKYHVLKDYEDPTSVVSPCGLIAWSVFNDSFALFDSSGGKVPLVEKGIAWPSDLEHKFINSDNGSTGQNFPAFARWRKKPCADLPTAAKRSACIAAGVPEAGWCYPGSGYCVEDEHFVVWMRAAGLPAFRKLYAKIDKPLAAGTYTVKVSNGELSGGGYVNAEAGDTQDFLYPVSSFGGTKSLVLSTKSAVGGRNLFLGYAYVVVGVVCVVLALCFFFKQKLSYRPLAYADYIQGPGVAGK